ncbi:hypothetical protein ACFLSZ_07175, partial [Candidatus Bipolaricaulota bacterium]
WLLIDGNFSLLLGTKALASTNLSGGLPGSEIALSPALTGVASVTGIVVKPSIGLDLSLGNQTPYPAISGSRVSATVDAGVVTASSTVFFIGNFETLSSVVVSICLPDCGLSVSASLVPTEIGGVRYRAGISYEWGNTSLLPILTGEPGTICTDEVCF